MSGYSGGDAKNADYRRVSSGYTNHAEAVHIYFDPEVISFETLLDIFFTAHDPTQLNRQGPDVGAQYRSEIFYHNEEQKKLSEAKMKELSSSFTDPIVTKLSMLDAFYDENPGFWPDCRSDRDRCRRAHYLDRGTSIS